MATLSMAVVWGQAFADEGRHKPSGEHRPVYQRQRMPRVPHQGAAAPSSRLRHVPGSFHSRRSKPQFGAPEQRVSSGAWFQRPYPYHLDYYRMRYGGTYEPYFSGGLYGTPQVIAPPVYGYGYGAGYGTGYGQPNAYSLPPY